MRLRSIDSAAFGRYDLGPRHRDVWDGDGASMQSVPCAVGDRVGALDGGDIARAAVDSSRDALEDSLKRPAAPAHPRSAPASSPALREGLAWGEGALAREGHAEHHPTAGGRAKARHGDDFAEGGLPCPNRGGPWLCDENAASACAGAGGGDFLGIQSMDEVDALSRRASPSDAPSQGLRLACGRLRALRQGLRRASSTPSIGSGSPPLRGASLP
mmetsp:Transcript_101123/g.324846  ORF Transcript_101123/g.324846 Transcript_101123/m.324846 type:complete len:215 (-) Transcript_101123:78-722(-)